MIFKNSYRKYISALLIVATIILLLSPMKKIKSNSKYEDLDSVKIAFWNIGHFSGGSKDSSITSEEYDYMLSRYKNFVYNEIDADIFAIAEYSRIFSYTSTALKYTKDVLFDDYEHQYEYEQKNYFCNALFSKVDLFNTKLKEYNCNKNAEITHTTLITAQDYYFIDSDLYINGELVKLVIVHLAFDKNLNPDTINQNQMYELIEKYERYNNVLMIGDWNCREFSYFDIFANAGYQLGNSSSNVITHPGTSSSIDNVVYKGVILSDFEIHQTTLSDHYAISCKVEI